MFAIPLTAYGFGIATMNDPSTFAIVWMVAIGLIAAIFMLAVLDAINTMRLKRVSQQQIDKEYRAALALSIRKTAGPELKLVSDELNETGTEIEADDE